MTCVEGTLEGELPLFTSLQELRPSRESKLPGYGKINKGFI